MTRRRELEQHRHSLTEIRDIMNSMKTLAYMETRKLTRFLDAQHAVVQSLEEVAADLLGFHADILPETDAATAVYLLIGTERGFCGDFNHAVVRHLESTLEAHPQGDPLLLAVGRKLSSLLEGNKRLAATIDGASAAEEITSQLSQVVGELTVLQQKHGGIAVICLHHDSEDNIQTTKLLPPFQRLLHKAPVFSHPPVLNVSPREFLAELTEHYLVAALHEILYASLMAENYRRVTHLEGAVKHLDDESESLARLCNTLRQEEIVEEIEVILLSSSNPASPV